MENNVKYQLEKRISKKTGKSYFCLVIYFEFNGQPRYKLFPLMVNDIYVNDLLNQISVEVK